MDGLDKIVLIGRDWNVYDDNDLLKISNAINNNEYEIGNIILDLREFLTNVDQSKRCDGMTILSSVLCKINSKLLSQPEVECIAEFYNNRLKDQVSVIESSLSGLYSLCKFQNYNFKMAQDLFILIQNEISIQLFKPDSKLQLYKIIEYIFDRFKTDFVELGSNFIYGFLRIIDAETSPTCLMVIFDMFYHIAVIPKFELFKEDIFESMACYFPIIYSKSKHDKYYETKIQLHNLLIRAMAATSSFCEFVMPLALEKLESESIESKISCYQLLQLALPIYQVINVKQFVDELWTNIRIDTLKPKIENNRLVTNALLTLTKLSDLVSLDSKVSDELIKKIWKDLEISLKSPELNLIDCTIKILIAFSSKNCLVYTFFFEKSYPILIQSFIFNSNLDIKLSCLRSLYDIVVYGKTNQMQFDQKTILTLFNLLIENSFKSDFELRRYVILCFKEFSSIHQFSDEHLSQLIKYFTNCVEESGYSDSVTHISLELVHSLSNANAQLLYDIFIKSLIQDIDSMLMLQSSNMFNNRILFHLNMLRNASYDVFIFNKIVDFLILKIIHFSNDLNNELNCLCLTNILETLNTCFSVHSSDSEFIDFFYENCIVVILDHFTYFCFCQNGVLPYSTIQNLGSLLNNFVAVVKNDIRSKFSSQVISMTLQRNISVWIIDKEKCSADLTNFAMKNMNQIQAEFFLTIIYSYFYSNSSYVSIDVLTSVFNQVKSYCFLYQLNSQSAENISDLSSKILAQIIQKFSPDCQEEMSSLTQTLFCEMKEKLNSPDVSTEHKLIAIKILIRTCKSLFLQKNQLFSDYIESLMDYQFDNEILTAQILKLVDIIYSNDDFLQKSHPDELMNPLEKFSFEIHDLILDRYNQTKKNEFLYLLLSHLKFIPQDKFAPQIAYFLPIILKGMENNIYCQINLVSLTLVQNILNTNYDKVKDHINSLLKSAISLSRKSPIMSIRKMALDCVYLIVDSSDEKDLINLKEEFVQSLRPTLSDHKRLVRASAVKTFCKVAMIGQPGNQQKH